MFLSNKIRSSKKPITPEWCFDWYSKSYYKFSPENNPTGPTKGLRRVTRGGQKRGKVSYNKITLRTQGGGNQRLRAGFRVVRRAEM